MITSVTPLGWWASKKQDITITGSGFLTSADSGGPSKVTASATGVTLKNVQVVSNPNHRKRRRGQGRSGRDRYPDGDQRREQQFVRLGHGQPARGVLPGAPNQWNNQTISGESAQPPSPGINHRAPVNLTTLPSSPIEGIAIAKSEWKLAKSWGYG